MFLTKFAQKECFQFKMGKVNTTTKFRILELVLEPNFRLNIQFFIFRTKFVQKENAQFRKEKVNPTIKFSILGLVLEPNFRLNIQFFFFGPNLSKE